MLASLLLLISALPVPQDAVVPQVVAELSVTGPSANWALDAASVEADWLIWSVVRSEARSTPTLQRFNDAGKALWSTAFADVDLPPSLPIPDGLFDRPTPNLGCLGANGLAVVAINRIAPGGERLDLEVHGLATTDGSVLWQQSFQNADYLIESLAVDESRDLCILAGRRNQSVWLRALQASDGSVVWSTELPAFSAESRVLDIKIDEARDLVAIGGSADTTGTGLAGFSAVLRLNSGALLWSHSEPDSTVTRVALDPESDRVYVAGQQPGVFAAGRVRAWDFYSNQEIWSSLLEQAERSGPMDLQVSPDGQTLISLELRSGFAQARAYSSVDGSFYWKSDWSGSGGHGGPGILGFEEKAAMKPEPVIGFLPDDSVFLRFCLDWDSLLISRNATLNLATGDLLGVTFVDSSFAGSLPFAAASREAGAEWLTVDGYAPWYTAALGQRTDARAALLDPEAFVQQPTWSIASEVEATPRILQALTVEELDAWVLLAAIETPVSKGAIRDAVDVLCIDRSTGEVRWTQRVQPQGGPATIEEHNQAWMQFDAAGGRVLTGLVKYSGFSNWKSLAVLDAPTGDLKWDAWIDLNQSSSNNLFDSPDDMPGSSAFAYFVVAGDRVVLVVDDDSFQAHLQARSLEDGAVLWEQPLGDPVLDPAWHLLAGSDQGLYSYTSGGFLRRHEPSTGLMSGILDVGSMVPKWLAHSGDTVLLGGAYQTTLLLIDSELQGAQSLELGSEPLGVFAAEPGDGFVVTTAGFVRRVGDLLAPGEFGLDWVGSLSSQADPYDLGQVDGGDLLLFHEPAGVAQSDWILHDGHYGDEILQVHQDDVAEGELVRWTSASSGFLTRWRGPTVQDTLICEQLEHPGVFSSADQVVVGSGAPTHFFIHSDGAEALTSAADAYFLIGGRKVVVNGPVVDGIALPFAADDPYFLATLFQANQGVFTNTLGLLDSSGDARATVLMPLGFDPGLAGLTLHHAWLRIDLQGVPVVESVSPTLPLELLPAGSTGP